MNIEHIKEKLTLMKAYLENPDYEMVGVDSKGFYGIDINDDQGGNLLKSSIDTNVISIIMFKPFACVIKNKNTNQLDIEYKFEKLEVNLNDKVSCENINKEDLVFIEKMLDFFEEKEKMFFESQPV